MELPPKRPPPQASGADEINRAKLLTSPTEPNGPLAVEAASETSPPQRDGEVPQEAPVRGRSFLLFRQYGCIFETDRGGGKDVRPPWEEGAGR